MEARRFSISAPFQAFVAGLAFAGRGVDAPDFFASRRVGREDVAAVALAGAGAPADHHAFDDDAAGGVAAAAVGFGVPALFTGAGVESDDCVGRGVNDEVLIDGEGFGAGLAGLVGRNFAFIFPEEVAGGGVEGLDDGAGGDGVHDAIVDERDGFGVTGAQASGPDHAEFSDVLFVDFF